MQPILSESVQATRSLWGAAAVALVTTLVTGLAISSSPAPTRERQAEARPVGRCARTDAQPRMSTPHRQHRRPAYVTP